MKYQFIILSLLLFMACQTKKNETNTENKTAHFFLGTYTNGESKGIYQYALNNDGSLDSIGLVAKTENPSFLALTHDKKFLLAVNEFENGSVESFTILKNKLNLLNKSSSGGAHPCHLAVNEEGYVVVANYTGGNVGLLKLNSEGQLSELLHVQQHKGKGPKERQKSPHAHSARFETGNNAILSADLGTDELIFSKIDTSLNQLVLNKQGNLKLDAGAGPRHFDFHPNGKWIYLVNELNCTVSLIEKKPNGTFEKIESISTLPENYQDTSYCADIHISKDGNFIYASNRGHNSITVFKVDEKGGSLLPISYISTKGKWPRNFSLSPNEKFFSSG